MECIDKRKYAIIARFDAIAACARCFPKSSIWVEAVLLRMRTGC